MANFVLYTRIPVVVIVVGRLQLEKLGYVEEDTEDQGWEQVAPPATLHS
jgi:hypothetical protein